jgi:hypothetical protein
VTQASVAEVIASLRAEGKSDIEIAAVLRRSRIKPPPGHYMWSAVSVREAVGEDPSDYASSGHQGRANR